MSPLNRAYKLSWSRLSLVLSAFNLAMCHANTHDAATSGFIVFMGSDEKKKKFRTLSEKVFV